MARNSATHARIEMRHGLLVTVECVCPDRFPNWRERDWWPHKAATPEKVDRRAALWRTGSEKVPRGATAEQRPTDGQTEWGPRDGAAQRGPRDGAEERVPRGSKSNYISNRSIIRSLLFWCLMSVLRRCVAVLRLHSFCVVWCFSSLTTDAGVLLSTGPGLQGARSRGQNIN